MSEAKKIHKAMQAVMHDVCVTGIGKDGHNKDQNFRFRGIEQAMNALAPLLVKHGIVCVPRHGKPERFDRITKSGGTLSFVTSQSEFDLVSVEDGSLVTIVTNGEGMDSSDKATNKAMSSAFKYALFQAFVVPTMSVDVDFDDGGLSEVEQAAERQKWIDSLETRLKCSTANIETLRSIWADVKRACAEAGDRPAADHLCNIYKKLAAEIADRAGSEE